MIYLLHQPEKKDREILVKKQPSSTGKTPKYSAKHTLKSDQNSKAASLSSELPIPTPRQNALIKPAPNRPLRDIPGPVGGKLIRDLIKGIRHALSFEQTPDSAEVVSQSPEFWVSLSGGPDSTALALALSRYGHRIIPKEKLKFIYFEHSWRPQSAKGDQIFLRKFAQKCGVSLTIVKLDPKKTMPTNGRSWEEASREERKQAFERLVRIHRRRKDSHQIYLLTAHHADDLLETLIWRFFTGNLLNHPYGILPRNENTLRPCLKVRKAELLGFLKEEEQKYLHDITNDDSRFLRARMRKGLIPEIEKNFPQYAARLSEYPSLFEHQKSQEEETLSLILKASHIHVRRAQWQEMQRWVKTSKKRGQTWQMSSLNGKIYLLEVLRLPSGFLEWRLRPKED